MPNTLQKFNMNKKSGFDITGIRYSSYIATKEDIYRLKYSWNSFVNKDTPQYPAHFSGRGIVICGGGLRYFTCSWISINLLRHNGCTLPIELWYSKGELNDEIIEKLKDFNVACKNVDEISPIPLEGYSIKPFAIINSSFKEVLFLDADNNSIGDPTYLFDYEGYINTGAVFWPDFWKTDVQNPIWKIVESEDYEEYEQESGQMLINKEQSWTALNLAMYFNLNREIYYKFLLGDKDTFKFAWKALKKNYTMTPTPVGYCGYPSVLNKLFSGGVAMVQHDFDGKILFIHANMSKWDVVKEDEYLWKKIKRFKPDAKQRLYLQKNVKLLNGGQGIIFDIDGDVTIEKCSKELQKTEKFCLKVLKKLRSSDFYFRFILYLYSSRMRREV